MPTKEKKTSDAVQADPPIASAEGSPDSDAQLRLDLDSGDRDDRDRLGDPGDGGEPGQLKGCAYVPPTSGSPGCQTLSEPGQLNFKFPSSLLTEYPVLTHGVTDSDKVREFERLSGRQETGNFDDRVANIVVWIERHYGLPVTDGRKITPEHWAVVLPYITIGTMNAYVGAAQRAVEVDATNRYDVTLEEALDGSRVIDRDQWLKMFNRGLK